MFKQVLGQCLATSHGRNEIRRCRGPFEKYFSSGAVSETRRVIGRESSTFLANLPIGEPVDLQEKGLADVTLRILVHVVYGEEVLGKYFKRIQAVGRLLEEAVDMFNLGATRLPLYSLLPTKAKQRARSFNEAWDSLNRFFFQEYEEGRLKAGNGLFFATMEQMKTHSLDLSETEVCLATHTGPPLYAGCNSDTHWTASIRRIQQRHTLNRLYTQDPTATHTEPPLYAGCNSDTHWTVSIRRMQQPECWVNALGVREWVSELVNEWLNEKLWIDKWRRKVGK